MATKAEQTERTRAALIAAGRRLFAEQGYAGTSTEELVTEAGVTRGALYHHFRDKRELFAAVFEDVESGLSGTVMTAIEGVSDPLEVLRRGTSAFLDRCLDPAVRRIGLLEGPTVLGWERWRDIDQRYGLGLVQLALEEAMDAGAIRPAPVEPFAHMMFGALVEAGMLLASSNKPRQTRAEVGAAMTALLDGLAVRGRRGRSG